MSDQTAPATCPDCLWPAWRKGCDFNFDESKHCLAAHVRSRPGLFNHDLVACLERTRDRLRSQIGAATLLLKHVRHEIDDGVALIDAGAPLGIGEYDLAATTRARIERQDQKNHELELRLAQRDERPEGDSSYMLIVVNPRRCGGQPTIGGSRLPLTAPLSRLRAGETLEELGRDWASVPPESWVVLKALAEELMPIPYEEEGDGE
ncbi:MAG TPA: DUF433 domain-containing protein [Polyangiaceae bacterium]|nr:DUF433 domain-containing protein [Polyangiaceae bacterium]